MRSCTFNRINSHETRHHEFFADISKTNIMQIRLQLIENKRLAASSDRIVWYSGRENAALQECRHGNVYMPMLGDFFRMRWLLNVRMHATFIEERAHDAATRLDSTWFASLPRRKEKIKSRREGEKNSTISILRYIESRDARDILYT